MGGASIPALALAAHVTADMRDGVLSAGFGGHVPKPVDAADLIASFSGTRGRATRRGGAAGLGGG